MKYDKTKFIETRDIIEDLEDHELNGDFKCLMAYFREIIKKNKKKYHRMSVRLGDCRFVIYGYKLIKRRE